MRNTNHRIFTLNFDSLRPKHVLRTVAALLSITLLGNSIAFAAGTPLDPVKLKQKLTVRGIGNRVKVTELDGTTVSGNLTAIRDDAFDVTLKKATQSITISYSQVSKAGNGGLTTGAKIGIGVLCVTAAAAITAVVVVHEMNKPWPPINLSGLGSLP